MLPSTSLASARLWTPGRAARVPHPAVLGYQRPGLRERADGIPRPRVLVLANVSDHPAHVLAETLSGFQTAAPDLLTDTGGRPARGDGAAGPRRGVAAGDRVPGGHLSGRGKRRATARPLNGAGGRAAGDATTDPWLIPSRTSPRRSP